MNNTDDLTPRLERTYQDELVSLFREQLGYAYLGKRQYARGENSLPDGTQNAPIIESELRSFLQRDETHYTKHQQDEAVRLLTQEASLGNPSKDSLLQTNNSLYERLTSHFPISPDNDRHEENVSLFDFKNPLANRFAIAEEVSYTDPLTHSNSRPDLVVYVNGIALAVIELKRCTVSFDEGIKQHLSNERDLIPSFFTTVQFTVAASDKNGFMYATVHTPKNFWCRWKRDDHDVKNTLSDKDSFLLFFEKETFMTLFRYGIINDGGIKKVMRPHQFYALKAAMPRLKAKAGGVIWHSQGSGKSLTMVWLAKYIRDTFPDPRVLVVTDRTELDMQIHNTFLHADESMHRATSSDDLLNVLQQGNPWLICTLVHKFGRHTDPATGKEIVGDDDAPIPMEQYLNELIDKVKKLHGGNFQAKGTNKFVFVDECHRTQNGLLHHAMRALLGDNVTFIGFTGTPLLHSDKKEGAYKHYLSVSNESVNRFGPFIHKYLHKEAVADHVILDLQYEARDVEQCLANKEQLDKKFEEIVNETSKENRTKIEERWATMQKIYSSRERIERIGYSILDDMSKYPLNEGWCNAMLVTSDIYTAYKYYEFFQQKSDNHQLRNRCAVVTSFEPTTDKLRKQSDGTDEAEQEIKFKYDMAKAAFKTAKVENADQYEAWAKKRFTTAPSCMKLLIVVDKLLTGFDAPSATYLYIDKDMRDHGLFQAVCRVNRLGVDMRSDSDDPLSKIIPSHKEFGLIVDFKHLFNNIQNAIDRFNDKNGALGGYDPEDVENLLLDAIKKNKERLEASITAYNGIKKEWESQGIRDDDGVVRFFNPLPPVDLIGEERERMLEDAKANRQIFYKIAQDLANAYANICDHIIRAGYTEEESKEIHHLVKEAMQLRERVLQAAEEYFNIRDYDPQMRLLLDRFVRADEARTPVPATTDFSFLDNLDNDITNDGGNGNTPPKIPDGVSPEGVAEVMEGKVRTVINNWYKNDPEQARTFAQHLQEIIDQIKKGTLTSIQRLQKLIALNRMMKNEEQMPEGINSRLSRSLFRNHTAWTSIEDEQELISKIREIEDYLLYDALADWRTPGTPHHHKCLEALKKLTNDSSTDEQRTEIIRLAANNMP
ncbi:MAG: HsdR family type I site-specific deoxyribonuclease [Prevotellaceae bacterium]|nr:HsdR family type I site-specific deoxyribonuclease [Prevotellaceae bacterium]